MRWFRLRLCPDASGRRATPPRDDGEDGAVMVEFAFALLIFFLLFTSFIKLSEIFLAHERLRYAASVASRAHAVGGPARKAAGQIDKDATVKISKDKSAEIVRLTKKVELPEAVGTLFGESDGFTVAHSIKTYMEPSPSGDNKAK